MADISKIVLPDGSEYNFKDATARSATAEAMVGASSSTAGVGGLVPQPLAGDNEKYLRGDGTWVVPTDTTYSDMSGATSSAAGTHGLVPAPAKGNQTKFLRGDGTWAVPTDTKYSVLSGEENGTAESLVTTGEKYKWNRYYYRMVRPQLTEAYLSFSTTQQNDATNYSGCINYKNASTNSLPYANGRFEFVEYAASSDGQSKPGDYELYRLPTVTVEPSTTSQKRTEIYDIWTTKTLNDMSGATSSAAGTHGLVPAPAKGKQTSFLRGDGTWAVPTNTTYSDMEGATSSAAGTHGLVPAPAKGKQTSFLRGDGTWAVPTDTTYSSKDAASGGTAVSLVTTGEKYTWDHIADDCVKTSGTQEIAGSKTFTSTHTIANGTQSPAISFRSASQSSTTGTIYYLGTSDTDTNTTYASGRFYFYQYSPSTDGESRTSYYDRYALPAVSAGKTGNNSYTILTTKNLSAGTGIDISGTTISNSGVRSIESGATNGTISVNTNGTSEEVSVHGLGAAAYKNLLDKTAAAKLTTASTVPTVRTVYYAIYNGFDKTEAGWMLDARAVNKLFILKEYNATWSNCAVNGKIDLTGTNFGYTAFPSGYSPISVVDYASGHANCIISFINARATGSGIVLRIANYSASAASSGTAKIVIAFAKNGAVDDSAL